MGAAPAYALRMFRRRPRDPAAVITGARPPRTVDIGARERRYLVTMGLRVACFALVGIVPGTWAKLACVAGAVVLPGIAVLLANAVDKRAAVQPRDPEPDRPQLPSGGVITGQVVSPPEEPDSAADR